MKKTGKRPATLPASKKEEIEKRIRKPPRPPRLSESDGGQGMNTNKHKYFEKYV